MRTINHLSHDEGILIFENSLKRKYFLDYEDECSLNEEIKHEIKPTKRRKYDTKFLKDEMIDFEINNQFLWNFQDDMNDDCDFMCDEIYCGSPSSVDISYSKIISFFQLYSNKDFPGTIEGDNLDKLKKDLKISDFSLEYFLFSYYLKCSSINRIQEDEWIRGMYTLKCDNIEMLKKKLFDASFCFQQYWHPEEIKKLLTHVFLLLKEKKESRTIDGLIGAKALCSILKNVFSIPFLEFITKSKNKCLNLDQFKIFVDFSLTYFNDINVTGYDPNDAFPTLYDDFVEFIRENYN